MSRPEHFGEVLVQLEVSLHKMLCRIVVQSCRSHIRYLHEDTQDPRHI